MLTLLNAYLDGAMFPFLLAMARMGAMLMLLPAIGDSSIPTAARVSLAMMLALVAVNIAPEVFPQAPAHPLGVLGLIGGEITIGLFFGVLVRYIMSAVHVAANIIAMQIGLAAAQNFDPAQQSQGALLASFMTVLAVMLIFIGDLHHPMIRGMIGSFMMIPPGGIPASQDMLKLALSVFTQSFAFGVQLSAPFLAYGLVFNVGLGLVSRLMPQLPVFFVAMPVNIYLGFAILFLTLGAIMTVFLTGFEDSLTTIFRVR